MLKFKCKKCGQESRYITLEVRPGTVGLYCEHCGVWQKWLNKNEKLQLKAELDNPISKTLNDVILLSETIYAYNDEFTLDDLVVVLKQIAKENDVTIPYLEGKKNG